MTQSNTLALTALPNGLDKNGNVRLTVILTPSISTDDGTAVDLAGTPFDAWTIKIQKVALSWSISLRSTVAAAAAIRLPANAIINNWNSDLWTAIFGGKRKARNRRGNTTLSESWRLSHNISELHERHRELRAAHAQRALNANMAKLATEADTIQQFGKIHASFAEDFECLTPPLLYLRPTLIGNSSDASIQVDQRKAAVAARSNIDSADITEDQKATIRTRIDHALDVLETEEGCHLQAPALYCIYRHCVASVLPVGVTLNAATESGNPSHPIYVLYKGYSDAATPLVPPTCSASGDPVAAYEHYVLMLLFHRRNPAAKECSLATPDFHQILGMLNHYPAMLRPLGLAFDLTFALPVALADGVYLLQVVNPLPDNILLDTSSVVSYETRCQLNRNQKLFCAHPRDFTAIDQGYLALDALAPDGGSAFNLSQEDADGSSLKFTEQAQNAGRASEYTSAAPTSMTSVLAANNFRNAQNLTAPTPTSAANPMDAPPAARTVGFSLLHENRLSTLESTLENTPPASSAQGTPQTPKPPASPLCAEDLLLGIRVDVKDGANQWRSLCNRKSTYTVHHVDDWNAPTILWSPAKDRDVELQADEGFVTFTATQSGLDDGTSQTQLHQSLFTWSGWSLSVPKPNGFKSVNESQSSNDNCQSSTPLSISTRFELPDLVRSVDKSGRETWDGLLPALRFNHEYKIRCRVVDLAGNSLPCADEETPHVLALNPTFSRHEPVRAPLVLLSAAIDRDSSPGEHVDRLIARDGQEPTSRYLVPPRESLRLAELHGVVTKQQPLPGSAFAGQNLMPDGSFPSVRDAHQQGWYKGEIDKKDKTNNQDMIFLNRKGSEFKAKNPFYPDPLAHYIRVKPFLLSDDPNLSRPLGYPFYVEIDPKDDWPNYLATVVNLKAKTNSDAPSVDFDNDVRPPSIAVNLPPAYTVILVISSAGYNKEDPQPHATDKTSSVALYQFHKSTVEALKSSASFKQQSRDLVGGAAHQTRLRKRFEAFSNIRVNGKTAMDILDDPNSYVDGDLPQMTPPRTLTFVHATQKPIAAPDFGPQNSAGDLRVVRALGQCRAAVFGGVVAHWLSTSKVTCHAEWRDLVDDVKTDGPTRAAKSTQAVAFAITASDTDRVDPDFEGKVYLRMLKAGTVHEFTDTRAHDVTYSLSAASRFRGYFPEPEKVNPRNPTAPPPDEAKYSRPSPREDDVSLRKLTVLSSVRPSVPQIAYIVPAFCWQETYDKKTRTWFSGRDVVLRAYFERPFCISGDLEGVAVVFATPGLSDDEQTQPFISRWGSDPTRPITQPIQSSALTDKNLCQIDKPAEVCLLAEGALAMAKPFTVQFAKDRRLWFVDIPINTMGASAPFVRLAFARWQPQALCGPMDPRPPVPIDPNYDARISTVVFADFIQISPNRWVSVQRRSDSEYVITVSGVFSPPENTNPIITVSLYSRWYATGKDTGWRLVDSDTPFTYIPGPASSTELQRTISSWTGNLKVKHSAANRKYRILIRENEWYSNAKDPRVTYTQFVDLP